MILRKMSAIPFGLRLQLLSLSALLLAVPWLGYQLIESFEEHLLASRQDSLLSVAKTAAGALQENPRVFKNVSNAEDVYPKRDLYAYELSTPPRLDGRPNEWYQHLRHISSYGRHNIIAEGRSSNNTLKFERITGFHGESLYIFLSVDDDHVVYRQINDINVHRNDNVQIALRGAEAGGNSPGNLRRYTIAVVQPGNITAFAVASRTRGGRVLSVEHRISGYWRATDNGYNLEITIPMDMVDKHLGFAVADVDNEETRKVTTVVGTSNIYEPTQIGTITIPSKAIETRLRELGYSSLSVQVLDRHRRIIARAGDITTAGEHWRRRTPGAKTESKNGWLAPVLERWLHQPPEQFIDRLDDAANVPGKHISSALNGISAISRRSSSDGTTGILSAAHPVIIDSDIAGAVVIEQASNDIIASRNYYIERLVNTSVLIVTGGATVLFGLGSILSWRVKRLRRLLEYSVDSQGRVRQVLSTSSAGDEIGALQRSFADVTHRLKQYNTWLEDMSRRLTHELRTPVTVVRSSLDNLSMQELDEGMKIYVDRANEGVHRLASILNSMSEARRLEQTLDAAELELFELTEVVSGCVQGYELAWAEQQFIPDIETASIKIEGIPDLIAQMLDKLVSNAVEFAHPNTPIKVRVTAEDDNAVIRVINDGPRLPETIRDRLFDSMVSVRGNGTREGSHLGLGLYIARVIAEFHGGEISASNRDDAEGVIVTVRLPTLRLTGRPLSIR